jgi:hypothetical protein
MILNSIVQSRSSPGPDPWEPALLPQQVVVLERDTLPSEPTHRAGTPQARHVHALLLSGQRALSELFPGFEQDLARAGAVRLQARVGRLRV